MVCRHVMLPEGRHAIVCGPRVRQKCVGCGRTATLLCDYPMPERKSGTCDKPICGRCTTPVGENADHCPEHAT